MIRARRDDRARFRMPVGRPPERTDSTPLSPSTAADRSAPNELRAPARPSTGPDVTNSVETMTIIDDLLAQPGLYLGIDTVAGTEYRGAARIVVTPLPGGSGVSLDYEVLNPAHPDDVRGHVEHTVVARTHDGGTIMVIGHPHADTLAVLRETEPGTFEVGAEGSPFPMKVVVSMPQPGQLRHSWWYGRPGDEAVERDVSVVTRVP